jgi:hypothetical protein
MAQNTLDSGADYDADLLRYQQRLALAQALQARARQPYDQGQMVGGRFIPNYAGMVSQVANAIKGRKMESESMTGLQAAQAAKEAARGAAADQYGKLRFGQTEQLGQDTRALDASGAEGAAPQATMQTPGNAVAAAMFALKNPLLQDIGKEDLKGLATQKDLLQYSDKYDPSALQDFTRGGPVAALKGRAKFTTENGIGVTSQDGKMLNRQAIAEYEPLAPNAAGIPTQREKLTGKEVPAGTFGNVSTTQQHAEGKFIDFAIKDLSEGATKLQDFQRQVPAIRQMPDLIAQMSTGQFADYKLLGRKVGEAFGLPVDTGKIANNETYSQVVGPQMVAMLKQFGSSNSLTDTDREAAEKISASDITKSPEAMLNAQKLYVTNQLNSWMQHEGKLVKAGKLPGVGEKVQYFQVPLDVGDLPDKLGITFDPKTKMFTSNIVTPAETAAPTAPSSVPAGPESTKYQGVPTREIIRKLQNGEL